MVRRPTGALDRPEDPFNLRQRFGVVLLAFWGSRPWGRNRRKNAFSGFLLRDSKAHSPENNRKGQPGGRNLMMAVMM